MVANSGCLLSIVRLHILHWILCLRYSQIPVVPKGKIKGRWISQCGTKLWFCRYMHLFKVWDIDKNALKLERPQSRLRIHNIFSKISSLCMFFKYTWLCTYVILLKWRIISPTVQCDLKKVKKNWSPSWNWTIPKKRRLSRLQNVTYMYNILSLFMKTNISLQYSKSVCKLVHALSN